MSLKYIDAECKRAQDQALTGLKQEKKPKGSWVQIKPGNIWAKREQLSCQTGAQKGWTNSVFSCRIFQIPAQSKIPQRFQKSHAELSTIALMFECLHACKTGFYNAFPFMYHSISGSLRCQIIVMIPSVASCFIKNNKLSLHVNISFQTGNALNALIWYNHPPFSLSPSSLR